MTQVDSFEFVLVLVAVILALEVIARKLRAPPAAALILGGLALTLVPGVPRVELDPQLILTLFLPPLLMSSAYLIVWRDFRRHVTSILLLAVGAVVFTAASVGIAVHLALPGLPWAACFALGAVVSPPDAVAASAILGRVRLPRRIVALLEGESLLNDATAIVLFRFAVAAALTGRFSPVHAAADFLVLASGGIVVGAAVGFAGLALVRRVPDMQLVVPITLLTPYASYIGGERLGASGVIAAVVTGLLVSWYQHEAFKADTRRATSTVWQVTVHLLEAFVFVLIGLSLRTASAHLGGPVTILHRFGGPILVVVGVVMASRFVWILASDRLRRIGDRLHRPGAIGRASLGGAVVMSWAGMRGVVTLAVALSLPDAMPGRDVILMSAFAVIFVTVLGQGTTLGPLIRVLGLGPGETEQGIMSDIEALAAMTAAQHQLVERLARDAVGAVIHPRLLEQYGYRANLLRQIAQATDFDLSLRDAHFGVVLDAVAAGRREVIRLHRAGQILDETLRSLEHDLDLQEISARRVLEGKSDE